MKKRKLNPTAGQNQPAATPMPSLPKDIKIIAPDGDIIFKVGKCIPPELVLVSSKVLASHSKVFNAMLNGPWAESGKVSRTSPGIIKFPDEDLGMFPFFLEMMHRDEKSKELPKVDRSVLHHFTVLCDKYDCTAFARKEAKTWTQGVLAEPRFFDVRDCDLLWITYIFDLPEEFYAVSRRVILKMGDSYRLHEERRVLGLTLQDYAEQWNPMPDKLKDYIVDRITEQAKELLKKCHHRSTVLLSGIGEKTGSERCKGQLARSADIIQWLSRNWLWNAKYYSGTRWNEAVAELKDERWWKKRCKKGCPSCKNTRTGVEWFIEQVQKVCNEENVEGVCLEHSLKMCLGHSLGEGGCRLGSDQCRDRRRDSWRARRVREEPEEPEESEGSEQWGDSEDWEESEDT